MKADESFQPLISHTALEQLAKRDVNIYDIHVDGDFLIVNLEYRYLNPRDANRPCWRKISVPFLLNKSLDYTYHPSEEENDLNDEWGHWEDWDIYMSQIDHLVRHAKQELEK